jgi:hypothetical protein
MEFLARPKIATEGLTFESGQIFSGDDEPIPQIPNPYSSPIPGANGRTKIIPLE